MAPPEATVAEVTAELSSSPFDVTNSVYIVGPGRKLAGVVHIRDLLQARPRQTMESIMNRQVACVGPGEDQEKVAHAALREIVPEVAVIDPSGRLLGVVPPSAIMDILYREHTEDLHILAGISRATRTAVQAIEEPPYRRAGARLPWLLVGLGGSIVATAVMNRFETLLTANIAVAFFIPGIVYLSDAIGTQTEAVAVRGLSLSHEPLLKLLVRELGTGFLIGLAIAAITFPLVWLHLGSWRLAGAVSLSLIIAGALATTIGLLLPWLLSKTGRDPAYGSGPVATVIQDILSLVVYFVVVGLLAG